jgi:hypothetical protein
MSQISRPFQIAFAAVALLVLVWLVALHRPSSGPKSSAESPAASVAPASTTSPGASSGAGGSASSKGASVYHGSAPGVEGLSKAIAKAHGAVATSQQNAQQLQQKSEQASSNTAGAGTSAASTAAAGASQSKSASSSASAAAPGTKAATKASGQTAVKTRSHSTAKTAPQPSSTAAAMPRQRLVERELAHGDVVALLFWSRTGADDRAVRSALYQLAGSEHSLVVHAASAKEVASFGTITRGIQVYGTPTVLLVGKHGRTQVLTGLQDAFALRQAASEVRHPS